ncbi:hypothetical protein MH117_05315 [Paenibacillus sp. ACRRX]|uniref:hypothetical protein n=1 Tax=Paenibacillus sp. ACRRX TaxID=2918206 RepID=UPI001EF4C05C|nr:hypothetical protein [Paenibacillus sp. ACRRX]MCG7406830.1 hypothetical protein [Paenibacillus sp. ACRRX]
MKKKLTVLLLGAVLAIGAAIPASAAPFDPNMGSYDIEPMNNTPSNLLYIPDQKYGSHETFFGTMDYLYDLDYYAITSNVTGIHSVYFYPPDNQQYVVEVFDKEGFDQNEGRIATQFFNAEQPSYVNFQATEGKAYIVRIRGINLTIDSMRVYHFSLFHY